MASNDTPSNNNNNNTTTTSSTPAIPNNARRGAIMNRSRTYGSDSSNLWVFEILGPDWLTWHWHCKQADFWGVPHPYAPNEDPSVPLPPSLAAPPPPPPPGPPAWAPRPLPPPPPSGYCPGGPEWEMVRDGSLKPLPGPVSFLLR